MPEVTHGELSRPDVMIYEPYSKEGPFKKFRNGLRTLFKPNPEKGKSFELKGVAKPAVPSDFAKVENGMLVITDAIRLERAPENVRDYANRREKDLRGGTFEVQDCIVIRWKGNMDNPPEEVKALGTVLTAAMASMSNIPRVVTVDLGIPQTRIRTSPVFDLADGVSFTQRVQRGGVEEELCANALPIVFSKGVRGVGQEQYDAWMSDLGKAIHEAAGTVGGQGDVSWEMVSAETSAAS